MDPRHTQPHALQVGEGLVDGPGLHQTEVFHGHTPEEAVAVPPHFPVEPVRAAQFFDELPDLRTHILLTLAQEQFPGGDARPTRPYCKRVHKLLLNKLIENQVINWGNELPIICRMSCFRRLGEWSSILRELFLKV